MTYLNRKNILLFQKIVPSYRVPVFRELHHELGVMVCHSRERKKNSSWKSFDHLMDYPHEMIKRIFIGKKETGVLQNIFPVLHKYRPEIVITEFSIGYFTFWMLWLARLFYGYKLVLWSHGVQNQEILQPFVKPSRKLALWFYKKADAVIFYSGQRKNRVAQQLDHPPHFFVAPNTLNTPQLDSIYEKLSGEREKIRRELKFHHAFHMIYLGRLLPDKRIDLILDTFVMLKQEHDVALHFIGEGPEMERIKKYQSAYGGIFDHGAIYDEEVIGKYLIASDLMIMPGYLGLSVVHAFAMGLPVISCRTTPGGPFHSPEAEYLEEGINGFFCDLSAISLASQISRIFKTPELLQTLKINARATVEEKCSLNNMILGFRELVNYFHR